MLVKIYNTLGDGEVIGGRDFVQEIENKLQDLKETRIVSNGMRMRNWFKLNANLVTEAPFLDNAHADIQDVFQQLLAPLGFAVLFLFIHASPDNSLAKDVQALRFDCNPNHLAITLLAEAVFK